MPEIERLGGRRRLVVDRVVDAPADAVWRVLTDTEQWPSWGPSVRSVECPDRYVELGSTGKVQLPGGVWIPFEVTSYEGYRWTWDVARIPATGHAVEPLSENQCRASMDVPLVAAGYLPVCRRALERIARIAER